jgi:hypothetical protein
VSIYSTDVCGYRLIRALFKSYGIDMGAVKSHLERFRVSWISYGSMICLRDRMHLNLNNLHQYNQIFTVHMIIYFAVISMIFLLLHCLATDS